MLRDVGPSLVPVLNAGDTMTANSAWVDIFSDLAALEADKRVTFMRVFVDSGVSTAGAPLRQI